MTAPHAGAPGVGAGPAEGVIRSADAAHIGPSTLYRILRLRQEVFVVEQGCNYIDLDGRDLEPETVHLWIDEHPEAATVSACLRLLAQPDGATMIGRVVTAARSRNRGLAGRLIDHALTLAAGPFVLNAQSPLAGWYSRFGFVEDGPQFIEDGIVHTPMRRDGPATEVYCRKI